MKALRLVGLAVTAALVLVMAGSLVAGLRRRPAPGASAAAPPAGERVRVEVLNAAGVPGLAREVTAELRDAGFDVVYFGNAHSFAQESTAVLDRLGKQDVARRVADVLGGVRVLERPDSSLFVDVTVVVGRDRVPRTATDSAR